MRSCFYLMSTLVAVSVWSSCTWTNYAWEPTGAALAPFSEEIPLSLFICSTRDKITNDSFVLGVRFGKDDDCLTSNDMFQELSEHILKQRRRIEHLSSASGSQPERYYYMGIAGSVILTADRPVLGRSAGEDLSDLFELYAYSGTTMTNRGLLFLSFPGYTQQLYVSNETITSGSPLSLKDILMDGSAVAMTEYFFKPKKSIDTSEGTITFSLQVPILGKTVTTNEVEGTVPTVIEVNDQRAYLNTYSSLTMEEDRMVPVNFILPKGKSLFRQDKN